MQRSVIPSNFAAFLFPNIGCFKCCSCTLSSRRKWNGQNKTHAGESMQNKTFVTFVQECLNNFLSFK